MTAMMMIINNVDNYEYGCPMEDLGVLFPIETMPYVLTISNPTYPQRELEWDLCRGYVQ